MSIICPTVTAYTVEDYREQMDVASAFTSRIHVDLGDGIFTRKTVGIADAWWPSTVSADIHLMYKNPIDSLTALIPLEPNMVIVHAESEGDLAHVVTRLKQHCIKVGVALLQQTSVESARSLIADSDYVLIFSGNLGSFGGHVDLSLLGKVAQIRAINPDIEIGWDGGVNVGNVATLSDSGVDVINVGGAIQKANQPQNAYRDLVRQLI